MRPHFIAILLSALLPGAAALRNGLALTPPMGWSNWLATGCDINETVVKANADALVSKGLHALGYDIIGVDDCWALKERDNVTGALVPNRTRFPSGMAALGDYLHGRGLKFGIYSSAGAMCCQNTMPGSLGYEHIDAATFASWGVDYLKYDGCFMAQAANVEQDYKRRYPYTPPPILRYPIMAEALNKTGRNITYLCNFPWQFWHGDTDAANGGKWVAEFCHSWRTGGDSVPGFGPSMSYIDGSDKYADQTPTGPGAWNHLDNLEVGLGYPTDPAEAAAYMRRRRDSAVRKAVSSGGRAEDVIGYDEADLDRISGGLQMSEAEERAVFSLFALVKSMLFIGADLTQVTGHSLATLSNTEVIAINQDPLGEKGRCVRKMGEPGGGEVWAVKLSGGDVAAVLLNRQGATTNITASWSELGLPAGAAYSVRDVWAHAMIGNFTDSIIAKDIVKGSALVVRLAPIR